MATRLSDLQESKPRRLSDVQDSFGRGQHTDEPTLPYVVNQVKKGFSAIPGLAGMAVDAIQYPFRKAGQGIEDITGVSLPGFNMHGGNMPITDAYHVGAQAGYGIHPSLGFDPAAEIPKDEYGQPKFAAELGGKIAEFAGMNVLPGVGTVARAAAPLRAAATELLVPVVAGEGAVMGEHLAEQAYPENKTAKSIGGILGSLPGLLFTQKAVDAAATMSSKSGKVADKINEAATNAGIKLPWVTDESKAAMAKAREQAALSDVAEKIGSQLGSQESVKNLSEAADISNKIPGFKENLTLGRITGSPTIRADEQHFSSTVPSALETATQKQAGLDAAIESQTTKRFPVQADTAINQGARRVLEEKSAKMEEGLNRLSAQEEKLASALPRGDAEGTGAQLRNIRNTMMQTARDVKNQKYADVASLAKQSGASIKMDDTLTIAKDINTAERNIFQDDPGVVGKILRRYSSETQATGVVIKTTPTGGKIKTFPAPLEAKEPIASFEEFQSLYREANKEYSNLTIAMKNGVPDAAQKLESVGKVLENLKAKIPTLESEAYGAVGVKFKEANDFYRTKYLEIFKKGMGGKIGQETKFGYSTPDSKIMSTLILKKNDPSGMKEFLEMAGGDQKALQVMENGVMDKLAQDVIRNDKVNPNLLATFIRQHKQSLDEVPAIRNKISSIESATKSLVENKNMVLDEQAAIASSTLKKIANADNESTIISNAMKSPKYLDELVRSAGTQEEKQAVAYGVLRHAMKQPDSAKFIAENEKALIAAMGKRHVEYMKTIAKAQEISGRVEVPTHLQYDKLGDVLKEKTGTSVPGALSDVKSITNRFASPQYIVSRWGIQWWNKLRNEERDKIMMDVIFNPPKAEALQEFLKTGSSASAQKVNSHLVAYGVRTMAYAGSKIQEERNKTKDAKK